MKQMIKGYQCPICKKIYPDEGKTIDGLVVRLEYEIEVGYSNGGWGSRRDAIDFSEEVCGKCFNEAMELFEPLKKFLKGEEDE